MEKFLKCPFCGAKITRWETNHNELMEKWVLNHHCDVDSPVFSIFIVADTKEDLISLWNNRKEDNNA